MSLQYITTREQKKLLHKGFIIKQGGDFFESYLKFSFE